MYTPKDNLSIEDFLGNNGSSLEPSVEGFKEIFEQTLDLSGKSYTMAEIIAELEKGTRYSNDIHNPGLEALARCRCSLVAVGYIRNNKAGKYGTENHW